MTVPYVHCDDLIDDESQPACLRTYLEYHRRPAIDKTLPESKEPILFATLRLAQTGQEFLGHWVGANPAMKTVEIKAGQRVRVVMASRFGDVGITPNLNASRGYIARVPVSSLDDFSDTPAIPRPHHSLTENKG